MVVLIFNIYLFKIQFILLGQQKPGTFSQAQAKDGPRAHTRNLPGLSQGEVSQAHTGGQEDNGKTTQPEPLHCRAAWPRAGSGREGKAVTAPSSISASNQDLDYWFPPHHLFCLPFKKHMAREKKNTKARGPDECTSARYE